MSSLKEKTQGIVRDPNPKENILEKDPPKESLSYKIKTGLQDKLSGSDKHENRNPAPILSPPQK